MSLIRNDTVPAANKPVNADGLTIRFLIAMQFRNMIVPTYTVPNFLKFDSALVCLKIQAIRNSRHSILSSL